MEEVQKYHEVLLNRRASIRNHRNTLRMMKKCWEIVQREDPEIMSSDEYGDFYSALLFEMTTCWDEDINEAILQKMWRRDAGQFTNLNYMRFCCSLFAFAEVWVNNVSQQSYDSVFRHILCIVSGMTPPRPITATADNPDCKPPLVTFKYTIEDEKRMDELNLSIGKLGAFDVARYYENFGTPTMPLNLGARREHPPSDRKLARMSSRLCIRPSSQRPSTPMSSSSLHVSTHVSIPRVPVMGPMTQSHRPISAYLYLPQIENTSIDTTRRRDRKLLLSGRSAFEKAFSNRPLTSHSASAAQMKDANVFRR